VAVATAVTGGAGFIGNHLADALLKAGHEVLVVDDLSTGRSENAPAGARFERIDIRHAAELGAAIERFRPPA
jgi:UDP-glucose 4-epimerase